MLCVHPGILQHKGMYCVYMFGLAAVFAFDLFCRIPQDGHPHVMPPQALQPAST